MSMIKTPKEIAVLKEGGARLSSVLRKLRAACTAGVSTLSLDRLAQALIEKEGGAPSFLNYRIGPKDPAYPAAVCVSINEEVVHGIPRDNCVIREGDIVGMDIGMWYGGLCTDMATTVVVGRVAPRVLELVKATRDALAAGIATIHDGSLISDIGAAIEDVIAPKEFGIVRDLVGHGVGHEVHEEPIILNYRDSNAPRVACKTGMVLAIEPMVNLGGSQIRQKSDGWTIVTADKSPSAHFELTVAVTDDGHELITPWPDV